MFKMVSILILATLVSCASKQDDLARLENEVESEDAKSFENIKYHFMLVLNAHPELKQDEKDKISVQLHDSINRHMALKDDESKTVQLLLKKIMENGDSLDKEVLKKRLKLIYESKSENIFALISYVKSTFVKSPVDDSFERDWLFLMRDFR